jgi:flagellin-like hook-associated protein FlgL
MPLGLRLNTALLSPLRNLSKSVEEGASARERLSSGLRITKASDDAAGLAVANSVDIDRRVYTQGLRNVNDGISYLNVAEGAVTEMGNIVTRLKELTNQGSNSTLGSAQRDAINGEVNALSQEYNRILRYASFNDIDLLSASNSSLGIGSGYSGANMALDLSVGRSTLAANTELGGSGLVAGNNVLPTAVSYDGRYVAFWSNSSTLVLGDTNGLNDGFLQDTQTGTVVRLSVSTAGVEGNSATNSIAISDDGNYAAFYSTATNLVIGDANVQNDVFIRNIQAGTTELVSVSSAGVQSNGQSDGESISADGRYVVFRSDGTNLVAGDANGVSDIFLRDTVAGTTTLISKSSSGVIGNGLSQEAKISADGRFVVYQSSSTNLVSDDTNGMIDIFKYEIATGTTTRVSVDENGQEVYSYNALNASVSADGRYVSYSSGGSFDSQLTGGLMNIWRKDTETGEVVRVTKVDLSISNGASDRSLISADGQFVTYYSSATNLVSNDTNGYRDVFVTDVASGVSRIASRSDAGAQADADSAIGDYPLISGNGQKVVFETTANNLISGGTLGGARAGIYATNPLFSDNVVNLMAGISVATADQASSSFEMLDNYQDEIINIKGVIGAYSSRLSSASATLSSSILSFEDAYSRIMDADIAAEATRAIQADLRTQSGLVAVKQAGKLSQLALDLLQGSFGD